MISDLRQRVARHNVKENATWTVHRLPVELVIKNNIRNNPGLQKRFEHNKSRG